MVETTRHDIELAGCTPEPLMAYLKALGILRLVSEQKDAEVRGWWKNDVFWLRSSLDRDALVKFLLEEYSPTPIVVPWSGKDFFQVNWQEEQPNYSRTPTSSKVIEAVLCTRTSRLEPYRHALASCKYALEKCGIDTKKKMEKEKWSFVETLRSDCADSRVIEWIDAAAVTGAERFAALLGSGGGSDGNTHFSDNFMQNLWDVLPDFDNQRKERHGQVALSITETSQRQISEAIFAMKGSDRITNRTSSLYDSGAVGGPNATQGMERESLSNPWDVILALEGTVCFAGAAAKRLADGTAPEAVFPFQVSASVTTGDRLADKEGAGKELWLPLWDRPARAEEVLYVLREGRAQCGPRFARSGVDIARAIASLGVDRGIQGFQRYAIVRGRVGGKNYNTAASLGQFDVVGRESVDLLREADAWLDDFRWKCAQGSEKEKAPARILATLNRTDSAIFEFCKYGSAGLFQDIVTSLGHAERELALTQGKFKKKSVPPIPPLSSDWVAAADDGSKEFAIARALASVHDPEAKIGPLRANLEPVDWKQRCRNWAEKDRAVVWNAADLATNLSRAFERRVMDGMRAGCERVPLASGFTVSLEIVAAFLAGELDDERIEKLLWGLILISDARNRSLGAHGSHEVPIPRAYALLKLLFLPRPLVIERVGDGTLFARMQRNNESGGIVVSPEPSIPHLLRAGLLGEACAIAMRRLRASGLHPMPRPIRGRHVRDDDWRELDRMGGSGIDPRRLAAALLIPIGDNAVGRLVRLAISGDDFVDDQAEAASGARFEGGTLS
ncbi:MAG: type I-G CRISPR-associated protein Cas8g1/Csx17 [Candidatus Binataceae bacterium]